MNKELEEDNMCKISIPLITNFELNTIDNNLDGLVGEFTKQVIHDKELLIAQHIIKRQQESIEQLKSNSISKETIKSKKEKLEKEYKEALENNSTKAFIIKCQLELIQELLEGE